jgi:Gas vesicle protein G
MGLLKLLSLPVTGPVRGGVQVLEILLQQAEETFYDESAIQEELKLLESEHRLGRVSDDEFERREAELLKRWLDARAYHAQKKQE